MTAQPQPNSPSVAVRGNDLCDAACDLGAAVQAIQIATYTASRAANVLADARLSRAIELLDLLDGARRHAERLNTVVIGDIRTLGADTAVATAMLQHPAGHELWAGQQ